MFSASMECTSGEDSMADGSGLGNEGNWWRSQTPIGYARRKRVGPVSAYRSTIQRPASGKEASMEKFGGWKK
jgi:hypothetical protein